MFYFRMDDVLRHVFGQLSPQDLMRCRGVDKHWRHLASETLSRRPTLDFETEFQKSIAYPEYLSEIIETYGKNLEDVRIGALTCSEPYAKRYYNFSATASPHHVTRDVMTSLIASAPRLKRLRIHRMIITLAAIEKMENLPETIQTISFIDCCFPRSPECREIIEKSFQRILKKAKNLREFHFMGDVLSQKLELSSNILEHISPTIQNLSISGAMLQVDDLTFLQNKKLHSLTLNYIVLHWSHELIKLNSLVDTLKYLDISKPSNISEYKAISRLKNLRELHANETDIDDDALIEIIRECRQLRLLSLSKCPQITMNSLREIKAMQHLEILNISSCNKINTDIVNILLQCKNLRDLDISHCYRIKSPGVEVLQKSFNLKRQLSASPGLPKIVPSLVLGGNVAWRDFFTANYPYSLANR